MAISTIKSFTEHHRLALRLKPILVGELYLSGKLKHPVYIFKNNIFLPVLNEGMVPSKELINTLIKNSHRMVYIYPDDAIEIKKSLKVHSQRRPAPFQWEIL